MEKSLLPFPPDFSKWQVRSLHTPYYYEGNTQFLHIHKILDYKSIFKVPFETTNELDTCKVTSFMDVCSPTQLLFCGLESETGFHNIYQLAILVKPTR